MSDSDNDESNHQTLWPLSAIFVFIFFGSLVYFWPSLIEPFYYFEFWTTKGDLWEAVAGAWPWYLWGFSATTLLLFFREVRITQESPKEKFIHGTLISVWAGVAEEIAFRWLFFFSALVMFPVLNWIFGGFIGLDLFRWLYQYILCPIANFFTFGYLEPYLMNGYGWAVGAAIISSNGRFRDGHAYQGPLGYVNSWFFGMYMHWIVFKYGIIPAILIHFLYDFIIFTLEAIRSAFIVRHSNKRVH